jgi:hypothetical protein
MRNIKTRYDLINFFIHKYGFKKYLEIGVAKGKSFEKVRCDYKIGVDPDENSKATHKMTSNKFFEINNEFFDIVFIDGLHHSEQVYKDILNSLSVLNKGGIIICHDMNPQSEERQLRKKITKVWNGDCWKAWIWLREERSDLDLSVMNIDQGCGIIKIGQQKLLKRNDPLEYKFLNENRKEWLNLTNQI